MKTSSSKGEANDGVKGNIDWELRPGGMLVQKRKSLDSSSSPMIKIKVSHGSYHHELTVPAQSTFGKHSIGLFAFSGSYYLSFPNLHTLDPGIKRVTFVAIYNV